MERKVVINLLEKRLLNLTGSLVLGWDSLEWLLKIYDRRTNLGW